MKSSQPRNRIWLLIAAVLVVALGAILALTGVLPKNHASSAAQGTQSDPNVGTSRYPAPTPANHTPAPAPVAVAENPNAIPALSDVNAKCQWADPHGNNPPSLQDDGVGTQQFSDMPDTASTNTLKCAIARAKAAGFVTMGNSVKCTEAVIELLDNGKTWKFRPFCMNVSPAANPTCVVNLVPTDYQGNFIWADQPSFRHQDTSAEYVRNLGSFAGC